MYYGTNAETGKPIICDRRTLNEPQTRGIFGCTGSGKTTLVREEIKSILRETNDTVFVVDLFGEYTDLVSGGGYLIRFTKEDVSQKNYEVKFPKVNDSLMSGLIVINLSGVGGAFQKEDDVDNLRYYYECTVKAIWDAISNDNWRNRYRRHDGNYKRNWLFLENIDLLFGDNLVSEYLKEIFFVAQYPKKCNCIITYISQTLSAFTENEYGKSILDNTQFHTFLELQKNEREIIPQILTERERSFLEQKDFLKYVENSGQRKGLFCYRKTDYPLPEIPEYVSNIIPFEYIFTRK